MITRLGLAGGSSTSAIKGHAVRRGIDVGHLGRTAMPPSGMPPMEASLLGLARAGSMLAASWFALCGYDVSWPLEPCRYDLLVDVAGDFWRVQVKTTRTRSATSWIVSLTSGGRSRAAYDPDDIDYFFIIDGDLGYYLIPVASVGGMHAISLAPYGAFRLDRDLHPADATADLSRRA